MHRSTLAKLTVVATAVTLVLGSNVPASTAESAGPASARAPAAKASPTKFMVAATGFASRVVGAKLPVNSDESAWAVIGCTNRAGLQRTNAKAEVALPGGVSLSAVKTRTWTTKNGGTVSAHSRQFIAQVILARTQLGTLSLDAVVSKSRAWHDARGFHASTRGDVADIVFRPVIGPAQHLRIPLPGQTITVPGLAKISLASGSKAVSAQGARADLDAIKLHVIPTNTTIYLAHSAAAISDNVPKAIYRGSAYGLRAKLLDGLVTSQRTPNAVTPCKGSAGKTRSRDIAELPLATGVSARALSATTRSGSNHKGQLYVTNTAKVARVSLGGGLTVTAIKARAHVTKVGKRFVKNSSGTTLGAIAVNGKTYKIPRTGVLEIPGIAKLESDIVERTRNSITVTALRVTMFNGAGGTVTIGYARAALLPTRV